MQSLRSIAVGATGVLLLVCLVCVTPGASDDQGGGNWDEYQQCKIRCNEMFGGVDIMPPRLTGGAAIAYGNCVQQCDRDYWKAYDKQFEDK